MSIQEKLEKLKNALVSALAKTYHYHAPSGVKAPYLVWQEEGEYSSAEMEGHKAEQSIYGFADFYTAKEFDPIVDDIQEALNSMDNCYWELSNVQYGDPTAEDDNLIHYTWEWRLW